MTILNKEYSEERRKFLGSRPILKAEDIADGLVYALSTPEHVQVKKILLFCDVSLYFVGARIDHQTGW